MSEPWSPVYAELAGFVAPLADLSDSKAVLAYLQRLGWDPGALTELPLSAIEQALQTGTSVVTELQALITDGNPGLGAITSAISVIEGATSTIAGLANTSWSTPTGVPADLLAILAHDVLIDLLSAWLTHRHPRLAETLALFGIYRPRERGMHEPAIINPADNSTIRTAGPRPAVDADALASISRNPLRALQQLYAAELESDLAARLDQIATSLWPALSNWFGALGLPGGVGLDIATIASAPADLSAYAKRLIQLQLPIRADEIGPLYPVEVLTDAADPTVGVSVVLTGEDLARVALAASVYGNWAQSATFGSWTVTADLTALPPTMILSRQGVTLGDGSAAGTLGLSASIGRTVGQQLAIPPDSPTRVELGTATATLTATFTPTHAEIHFELASGASALVISSGDGDSFLAKVLPRELRIPFAATLTWDSDVGLKVSGGVGGAGGLEFAVPVNMDLTVVHIDQVHIAIVPAGPGLTLTGDISGALSLGPIHVTVTRIGMTAGIVMPAKGASGNLGLVDISIGFKPPTGLGLEIEAGPVSGGGFAQFDSAAGRYAGVLSLSLYNIQVKAIGLLDTKLPNNTPGYSLLIIISVEFTPIQLGFGFTLNGVGGLAGINRNFVVDAIQAGLRQHNLDHILFPKDPVKNAPAIISDLRTIFPPAEGRYVFGPMLELGWGGGAQLVTAELGVLLSLPAPVVIAVLGQLNVTLPGPVKPAVELHLDVLGIIDFGQKTFSLDAVLHDSRIVTFPISGEMAMRLSWGQNPVFALSIGGTNPQWNQLPAGFPTLKRLTIALSASSSFRLTIQSYLAITSNTFQFGARAELTIGAGSFNVYGWIGFDALLIFTPFSFVVDFTAGLALRSGTSTLMGISVDGELSGPTPWHAKGDAHISILFFEISVHIDTTWGDPTQVKASVVDVWPLLKCAIANLGNWSGALPASVPAVATLAKPSTDTAATVLVDPSGVLTLRERLLPLNQTLAKFGEAIPGPQNAFLLKPGQVTLGGVATPFTIVRDKFAPAQFEQLSDQEKLSRPSFEDRDAGFTIGAGQLACGTAVGRDVVYADAYLDDHAPIEHALPPFQPTLERQLAWARVNPAANSRLRATAMGKYAPPPTAAQLLSYAEERFAVATTTDLTGRPDITRPVTKGEANQALAAHLTSNPHERGLLQVVPTYELAP